MKNLLKLIPALALGAALTGCGSLHDEDTIWNAQRVVEAAADFSDIQFTAGTFVGIGTGGFYGEVHVQLIINDEGVITDVDVVYSGETPAFADMAYSVLIPAVLNAQSANVDTVTNATTTSRAFLAAVLDAMMQASDGALPADFAPAPTPEDEETDEETRIPNTEQFYDYNLQAGRFYGSGIGGFGGDDFFVAIEVNASGEITEVEVVYHQETPGFANRAFGYLLPDAIAYQTANIDLVSGATLTSEAFVRALSDAMFNSSQGIYWTFDNFLANAEVEIVLEDENDDDPTEETEAETPEETAPEPVTETAADTPAEPAFAGGTFTASATGSFDHSEGEGGGGSLTISLTLDTNRNITALNITQATDTPAFVDMVVSDLLPRIMNAGHSNVDVTTSATYTSNAVRTAVSSALAQAN